MQCFSARIKGIIMNIFKNTTILAFIGFSALYSNIESSGTEESIRQNEVVIDALQKQLDSMQSKGEKDEAVKALQSHIDSVIEQQNKLLAQKIAPVVDQNSAAQAVSTDSTAIDNASDARFRRIVQEELAKAGIAPKPSSPYDTTHTPTPAELNATKSAEMNAPALPEQKSEAMGQYELALELYNKGTYKEAAAGFGRIIKTYSKDPIAAKALVHLAYCLEKQGDAEGASIVCEAALKEKLDDPHQVDCQLMRLRYAKSKGNEADVAQITQSLRKLPLTEEQQKVLGKSHAKKLEVAVPAKTLQPKVPAKVASTTMPDKPKAPTLTPSIPLAAKASEPAAAAA
jgi:TolA-binding protein